MGLPRAPLCPSGARVELLAGVRGRCRVGGTDEATQPEGGPCQLLPASSKFALVDPLDGFPGPARAIFMGSGETLLEEGVFVPGPGGPPGRLPQRVWPPQPAWLLRHAGLSRTARPLSRGWLKGARQPASPAPPPRRSWCHGRAPLRGLLSLALEDTSAASSRGLTPSRLSWCDTAVPALQPGETWPCRSLAAPGLLSPGRGRALPRRPVSVPGREWPLSLQSRFL